MPYDYDAAIIGGGAAGVKAATLAAKCGAKTLLIEADTLGGDTLWRGGVPSKTLLRAAKIAHQMRQASRYGLMDTEAPVNAARLLKRLAQTQENLYESAYSEESLKAANVEVRYGKAHFLNSHTLALVREEKTEKVSAKYFFIATGARPAVPKIQGIEETPYLTSDSLFDIERIPHRIAIIGGGPIGVEMAQAFHRLGTEVLLFQSRDRILPRDDAELTTELPCTLRDEGVWIHLASRVLNTRYDERRECVILTAQTHGGAKNFEADALIIATGRVPNIESLNLRAAGVEHDAMGVRVTKQCRTLRRHIYACGDVTGETAQTHVAERMAQVAVANALLGQRIKLDERAIPWCTFTDPEIAQVGATEEELKAARTPYKVHRFPYSRLDRAVIEDEAKGLVKVLATGQEGTILGVSVLGAQAGEIIGGYAFAMQCGIPLRRIASIMQPYPTYASAVQRAAEPWEAYTRPSFLQSLVRLWRGYHG